MFILILKWGTLRKYFILLTCYWFQHIFLVSRPLSQSKSKVRQRGREGKLHVQLLASDWLRILENQHNEGFPLTKKHHFHAFPVRSTTYQGLPKSSRKISYWESSFHFSFQTQFSVQWFVFWKFNNISNFPETFRANFSCFRRTLGWMGLVPFANVMLNINPLWASSFPLSIFNSKNSITLKNRRSQNRAMLVSLYGGQFSRLKNTNKLN